MALLLFRTQDIVYLYADDILLFIQCVPLPHILHIFNHSSWISEYKINRVTSTLLPMNDPTRLLAIPFKTPVVQNIFVGLYSSPSYKHCVN